MGVSKQVGGKDTRVTRTRMQSFGVDWNFGWPKMEKQQKDFHHSK